MRAQIHWRSAGGSWHRPVVVMGILGLAAAACFWGRYTFLSRATAQPGAKAKAQAAVVPAVAGPPSDYASRPVAYIYGHEVITRQDLGEYLLARLGAERLELLVNKRIIDEACKAAHIQVTAAEVDATLADDLKALGGINVKEFVDKVLKRYNKNLYEWKEDVIRPKLALGKLCHDRVHVTDEDLKAAFEAYYGEKVDCQLILWPKGQEKFAMSVYAQIRDDEREFDRVAKQQASSQLAATGGHVKPFGRHTTGNDELEKEAFSLKPGEVSRLIETPEGIVVVRLIKRIPPDTSKKFEKERPALYKEVFDKKLQQEIPLYFKELRDKAHPILLQKPYATEEDWLRDIRRELPANVEAGMPGQTPPHTN